jgi:hypothetical protein
MSVKVDISTDSMFLLVAGYLKRFERVRLPKENKTQQVPKKYKSPDYSGGNPTSYLNSKNPHYPQYLLILANSETDYLKLIKESKFQSWLSMKTLSDWSMPIANLFSLSARTVFLTFFWPSIIPIFPRPWS